MIHLYQTRGKFPLPNEPCPKVLGRLGSVTVSGAIPAPLDTFPTSSRMLRNSPLKHRVASTPYFPVALHTYMHWILHPLEVERKLPALPTKSALEAVPLVVFLPSASEASQEVPALGFDSRSSESIPLVQAAMPLSWVERGPQAQATSCLP